VTDEPAPENVNASVPVLAPNRVAAPVALTVSFGAANTEDGLVRVMLFPPVETSAIADPDSVAVELLDVNSTAPVMDELPFP
jgi:hypothetical protein